ncbi:MAG: hypothetical protein ABSD76_18785 [Terriglobales bacterium]|jgi:hypothetical protein
MKVKRSLIAALSLVLAVCSIAVGKEKKGERGMLESMQSVPCGAKERGLTGLGSMAASVGVAHVNSHEQLCAQYLLRTDDMDYHIRPFDTKHPVVLPVGHEAEFKIKNDRLLLKIADGDKEVRKERPYQVVSMQPANSSDAKVESGAYRAPDKPVVSPAPNPPVDKASNRPTGNPPPD